MPLSSSALVNRDEVLDMIAEMQETLPDEIKQARWIVKDREELLAKAQPTASGSWSRRARTSSGWRARRRSSPGPRRRATASSPRPSSKPWTLVPRPRSYVDAKLAQFEIALRRILEEAQSTTRALGQDARPGRGRARPAPRPDDRRGAGVR